MFNTRITEKSESTADFEDISLESLGGHLIFGDVDTDSMKSAVNFIIKANHLAKSDDEITFFINTLGGNAYDGFSLIDMMSVSRLPIRTIGMGSIVSMGVLILCAGHPGRRIITRNTEVMAHQFSSLSEGKFHELVAATKAHSYLQRQFMEHFRRHSSMDEKTIKDVMFGPSDRWLSPTECKALGLVDAIVDELPDFSQPMTFNIPKQRRARPVSRPAKRRARK